LLCNASHTHSGPDSYNEFSAYDDPRKVKYKDAPEVSIVCGLSKNGSWAMKREGASSWDVVERKNSRYSSTSCGEVIADLSVNPSRLNTFYSAMGDLELKFLHKT